MPVVWWCATRADGVEIERVGIRLREPEQHLVAAGEALRRVRTTPPERTPLAVGVEEDTPVADATPEGKRLTLQRLDVAGEGVRGHRLKRGEQSFALGVRCASDGLLRGRSEEGLRSRLGGRQGGGSWRDGFLRAPSRGSGGRSG